MSTTSPVSYTHLDVYKRQLYGTPEHGQPIVGTAVILREGFVAGELDFMSLDDGDEVGLMLLFSALGICIKNESEAE